MDTQPEGLLTVREDDHDRGPKEEWSLTSHSPGQEPWIVGLEELLRLQRAAGEDDGLAGELALVED
jgi:hypothetical protein